MPEYTAEIIESDVLVARAEGNRFSIVVKPPSSGKVTARVSIPCGPSKKGENTFLLKDEAARPNVTYRVPGNSDKPLQIDPLKHGDPKPPSNYLAWEIPSRGFDAGTTVRIDVTGFGGNIPPGKAKIIVGIRERAKEKFDEKDLYVAVTVKSGDEEGVKIHYFDASKDYVLHAGQEEVVLSWHTSTEAVTLFKNNVKVWPPSSGRRDLFFKDTPSITSVYRLEARATDNKDSAEDRTAQLEKRSLTVQVAQAGWNRQPLHQGYPTVLMSPPDSERLYGVFVKPSSDPNTKATGLYSSATGFPPWRKESAGKDFNDIEAVSGVKTYSLSDMSESPGVAYGDKLWLIGGSSVDPSKTSNAVWYYHKNNQNNEWEWVRDDPGPFTARMGHCVVGFKGQLWVLGGSDGASPLNDVCSYDYTTKNWSKPARANWSGRCLFAAVASPQIKGVPAFEKEKIWVYGGSDDPDTVNAATDLWSTTDGVTWKEETTFKLGRSLGRPNGATLFWDDGLHLAGSFRADSGDDAATLSATVFSLCPDRNLWEANAVSWGWEQFGGNTFLLRSIVFNRFWFFWSLRHIKTAPKPTLNVFIPS
jgi:Kelch motif